MRAGMEERGRKNSSARMVMMDKKHSINVGDEVSWDGASPGRHVVTRIQQHDFPKAVRLRATEAALLMGIMAKRVVINLVEYEGVFGEYNSQVTLIDSEGSMLTCALECIRIW